jgi:adenylate cyclase
MPQIVIEQPGVDSMTVPIVGETVNVGREKDNHVVLVADEVSRHHARFITRGDRIMLMDLNSLNGIYVNRQRVHERMLDHMDEVLLGSKCRMIFRDDTHIGTGAPMSGEDSTVIRDLDRIRAELETAGNNLTMIGRAEKAPAGSHTEVRGAPSQSELHIMSRAYHRLAALYEASKVIASDFDLSKRLSLVLDTAIEVMEAERGFVMLRDEESGGLRVHVARRMGQDMKASSPSMGVAGRASIDGEPVLMTDSGKDSEFGNRDSIVRQQITSAMAVPLRVEGRILGAIYLDSRHVSKRFVEQDLELFASLGAQLAMAIENVRLYEQMVEAEKKRANLGRFLSPAIVDEIMHQDQELELGGRKRMVTSLFCDVRGFTPIAERMAASELVDTLNHFFTEMTEIIFENQGTLDKYMGDEIMAVFGSPLTAPDDAARAVTAAVAMQARNHELNVEREREGSQPFEIGIGIATGEVIAGCIGSPKRMEFTVIGDRVNTAKRLTGEAGPGQILVARETYDLVEDRVEARNAGALALKGKEETIEAFEILGLKDSDSPTRESGTLSPAPEPPTQPTG